MVAVRSAEPAQRQPEAQADEAVSNADAPLGQTAELPADEIAALANAETELMQSPFDEPAPDTTRTLPRPTLTLSLMLLHRRSWSLQLRSIWQTIVLAECRRLSAQSAEPPTPVPGVGDPCRAVPRTDTPARQTQPAAAFVAALSVLKGHSWWDLRSWPFFVPRTGAAPRSIGRSSLAERPQAIDRAAGRPG